MSQAARNVDCHNVHRLVNIRETSHEPAKKFEVAA